MQFTIATGLSPDYKIRWDKQFVAPGRDYLESIWRRSEIAEKTSDPRANRRRMIHVIDKYDMLPKNDGSYDFAITECYLWLCSTLPREEVTRYTERLHIALTDGSWTVQDGYWTKDGMSFSYKITDKHPEDSKASRDFGTGYQTIECTLISDGFPIERAAEESPWSVYNTGIRAQGKRVARPIIVTGMEHLIQYLPAQIELGGGASLELGIPPLNYFHTAYNLYVKGSERFAYGDTDNLLTEILPDPASFYSNVASLPYARAFTAEPNNFYSFLAELHNSGRVVGPVITNNFDGMCSLVGLDELYVRKYDDAHIVPDIVFAEGARSLIVIGSHADRRLIQKAAKAKGLKIIYVDPEKYIDHGGNEISYPLEKLEADDILVPLSASEFAKRLSVALSQKE